MTALLGLWFNTDKKEHRNCFLLHLGAQHTEFKALLILLLAWESFSSQYSLTALLTLLRSLDQEAEANWKLHYHTAKLSFISIALL